MSYPEKDFFYRHKFISFLRDLDMKGIRRLSVTLPKLILPNPKKIGKHELRTLHGIRLLIDPSIDQGVELALFQTGTYEKGTIQFIQNTLKPGDSFLDVGANIGLMTAIASKKVGQNGFVYAVEANPNTVEILQHNIALNNLTNVEILATGVSDIQGKALFYENWQVNRGGASLISQGDQEGVEIKIEKLDDLFQSDTPLHLVKIDVEGKEPEVIRGGMQWFQKQLPIFIIEVSSQRVISTGASPIETLNEIRKVGAYTFWKHDGTKERRGKLKQIHNDQELPEHDNVICIPVKTKI